MVQFAKPRGTILATSCQNCTICKGFKKDVSVIEIVVQKISKKYRILPTDKR